MYADPFVTLGNITLHNRNNLESLALHKISFFPHFHLLLCCNLHSHIVITFSTCRSIYHTWHYHLRDNLGDTPQNILFYRFYLRLFCSFLLQTLSFLLPCNQDKSGHVQFFCFLLNFFVPNVSFFLLWSKICLKMLTHH